MGDELITPPGLQVREVTSTGQSVIFTASDDPAVVEAWSWSRQGGLEKLTEAGGVSNATGDGPVKVVVSRSMSWPGPRTTVSVDGSEPRLLSSKAEAPVVVPGRKFPGTGPSQAARWRRLAGRARRRQATGDHGALRRARGSDGDEVAEPVARGAVAGGPGFCRRGGRRAGHPRAGPAFEREVYRDLAMRPLEDQVEALYAAAEAFPELDLTRVGMRGWSFGGFLSALAVLARPDVFHAAVAGAPVTDWHWYDTYYTERFLGRPQDDPGVYERNSLLPLAANLSRPLLLVHGLVDDNVFAVHTLSLSGALLAAGRPHSVLPLPAVTHVATREDVAENLLLTQVDFFRRALAEPASN